jgi:cell wall-associated NlpC family hydrolase
MLARINEALAEIGRNFQDTRVQYCKLETRELIGERCVLAGSVLAAATLTAVADHLSSQFPTIIFDTKAVTILRQSPPKLLTVSTNLTGLHRGPARSSERVSEVSNGQVVEQLEDKDSWVFVRQMDGYLGYVYRPYLTESPPPRPTHIVTALVSLLRAGPDDEASLVSRLMGGTKVAVTAVAGEWAQLVLAGERDGWVPASDLRAVANLPIDENGRRAQMVWDSMPFVGVPYLWGGCSALGIDCSGLAQLLHRQVGVTIPRDADMQFDAGQPVEPPFQPGDLLFFGSDKGHRSISHVAVSLGGWQVIHSSGPRNGVYEDDVQAVSWLRDTFLGARTFVNGPNED